MKLKTAGETMEIREKLYEQIELGDFLAPQALVHLRRAMGITQAQYAKMVGVHLRTIIDFENGKSNPTMETMNRLGKPFGLVVSYRRSKRS